MGTTGRRKLHLPLYFPLVCNKACRELALLESRSAGAERFSRNKQFGGCMKGSSKFAQGYSGKAMLFAIVTILLLCPVSLLAQRAGGGGRGGRGGSGNGPKPAPAESEEMKDFKKAISVQANEQQVSWFLALTKDTRAARNRAEDLAQHPATAKDQAATLAAAVEKARSESRDFLANLNDAQKAGLKALRKNVEKAESEVGKSWKTLNQDLGRSKVEDRRMTEETEKLEKALAKFETEQLSLGGKMGIQPQSE
jgi:hypothetical protein